MVELSNDFLKVELAEKGAEVRRIYHQRFHLEYLWDGNPSFWNRCSPVLFPIVGKLKENTYTYKGKPYHLTQHGFARDTVFTLEHCTSDQAVFSISSSEETRLVYPFDFKLCISYKLIESSLLVEYKVINKGEGEMLFSIGAHPGFRCPLEPGSKFEDYSLIFEKEETAPRILVGKNGISRSTESVFDKGSNALALHESLFGEKDAIIFKELKSSYMSLSSSKSERGLRFDFKGFPYMGIWTKPGPFLCIEPWFGIADFEDADGCLENKEGIIHLPSPEMSFEASYTVTFF